MTTITRTLFIPTTMFSYTLVCKNSIRNLLIS